MYFFKYLGKITLVLLFVTCSQASELVRAEEELVLGRGMPAYFKIMDFDKTKWERFADAFSAHPVAQAIKQYSDSIQLAPLVFSRDEIFATAYFKGRMRERYCELFSSSKPSPPYLNVSNDEMYAGILGLLSDSEGDSAIFEGWINDEMTTYARIIDVYNHRLEPTLGGNSALLKHLVAKIFFDPATYTDENLAVMRMTLLTEGLVAGDDYLFAPEKNTSHTLAQSILKCIELKGAADTLVIGCGNSLIADIRDLAPYFADNFLMARTGKAFVHDCQHCLCDHSQHICVAITEQGLGATIAYDGAAHADIFADATRPEFWDALKILKDEGRSSIRCIVDHAFMLKSYGQQLADCLDVGGEFVTYLDEFNPPLEDHGFELRGRVQFGDRKEKTYVKVR